jgi:alcohol dehydrogenase class IV
MALIYYLTHVHLDYGTRELLPAECERIGIRKPLIVTDAGVRAAGVLQKVLDALPTSLRGPIYDRTPSNPTETAVREAAAMFIEHRCDGLIAVGGGSSLDCAKRRRHAPGPLRHLRPSRRRRQDHRPRGAADRCPPPRHPAARWHAARS